MLFKYFLCCFKNPNMMIVIRQYLTNILDYLWYQSINNIAPVSHLRSYNNVSSVLLSIKFKSDKTLDDLQ